MQDGQTERRRTSRLRRRERVAIRPLRQTAGAYATTMYSFTVDISPQGLQVELDERLPVGHILDLTVQLNHAQRRIKLAGEVRWTARPGTGKMCRHGFLLRERHRSDIKRWRRLFLRSGPLLQRAESAALYTEMSRL